MTKCVFRGCVRCATRFHCNHDTGELQHLCEEHYALQEPGLANWPRKIYRRERPLCREALLLLAEGEGISIAEMCLLVDRHEFYVSKNMRTQLRKMVQEVLV